MTFLLDKRRGTIAALGAVVATAALFFGAGSAAAATGPCDDNPFPTDVWVGVGGLVFVGAQPYDRGTYTGAWVCATPPGKAFAVEVIDRDTSKPGAVVWVSECNHPTTSCQRALDDTGAEVGSPVTSPNEPGGGDGTGGVVKEPGACVYADGTPTCPFGSGEIAEVSVAEGDLPEVHTTPGCVNVNGTCMAPTVDGARVTVFGDTANDTVYVDTLVGGTSDEHLPTCVGVDDPCP